MSTLTPKELKVYDFIQSFSQEHGYSPTYAEIQEALGYKAVASVQQFVDQLTKKGFLRSSFKHQARSLEPIEPSTSLIASIPLEGYVAAGRLTEAVNNREFIEIPQSLMKTGGNYFALKIKGDSMIDDGIHDGDIAVIRKQHTANNGQTVVALVDREATIKKYIRRAKHIELHPANRNYNVIRVEPDRDFSIVGILSSLIRQLD